MQLVTFTTGSETRLGVLRPSREAVVDLSVVAPDLPRDMLSFIEAGEDAIVAARRACVEAPEGALRAMRDVRLLAPLPAPRRNLMCVGKNYGEHAREFGRSGYDPSGGADAVPEHPIIFTKATTAVIGPGEAIPAHLDPTETVDYEGELAVVIGKGGRGIAREDAFGHVFGYTIVNDVTSRDLQQRHKQWFLGKSLDGFCPIGPAIVTADEVDDVTALRLVTRVDGEVRQDAPVSDLIFDIPALIEVISATMTLLPGDIIATGTPAGVGLAFDPPRFLRRGSVVSVTIEPIGTLTNPVE